MILSKAVSVRSLEKRYFTLFIVYLMRLAARSHRVLPRRSLAGLVLGSWDQLIR